MVRTINVIFTSVKLGDVNIKGMKQYLFLCNDDFIKIGDLIEDLNYNTPMQVVGVNSSSDKVQNGITLKTINLTRVNGEDYMSRESLTNDLILNLRGVILIPDSLDDVKDIIQLLWAKGILNNPWNSKDFENLETCYYDNKIDKGGTGVVINITGVPHWGSIQNIRKMPGYKSYRVIHSKSSKENMEERTIKVSIEEAREWYMGDNQTLKILALKAYKVTDLCLSFDYIRKVNEEKLNYITTLVPNQSRRAITANTRLAVIADYLNDSWERCVGKTGYFIGKSAMGGSTVMGHIDLTHNIAIYEHKTVMYAGIVYFKSVEDARKAAILLGDEVINLF